MSGDGTTRGKLNAVESIDLAIQRTRYVLFEPFLYSKWLNLGVMVFLAVLGGGRGGISNYATYFFYLQSVDIEDTYLRAEAYVLDNLSTAVIVAVPILALILALAAGLMYVGARGAMMVIRAVALDDDDIGENWRSVAAPAWTYFVFRLELAVVMTAYLLVAGAVGYALIRQQLTAETPNAGLVVGIFAVILVTTIVSIAYGLAMFSLRNFIAPLIYHFKISCGEAWSEFFAIVRSNPAHMLLYLLLKIVFSMVQGVANTLVVYCTCCVGFLPVINQAILAPFHVFERAYSLQVLATLGPEYDMIQKPPAPEPPMLPPRIDAPPSPDINW